MQPIINFDHQIFLAIYDFRHPILDWLMLGVSWAGEFAAIWLFVAVAIAIFSPKNGYRVSLLLIGALALGLLIDGLLFKHFFFRPRPFMTFELQPMGKLWTNSSFPSAHVTSAVAAATVLSYYFRRFLLPLVIFVVLTMYARIYLGMHYPSDVILGVIVGVISGVIVLILFKKREKRRG